MGRTTTKRGVLVTVERSTSGWWATTTYKGETHGHTIPDDQADPADYAAACARGIAHSGVDGRKSTVPVYLSCS